MLAEERVRSLLTAKALGMPKARPQEFVLVGGGKVSDLYNVMAPNEARQYMTRARRAALLIRLRNIIETAAVRDGEERTRGE